MPESPQGPKRCSRPGAAFRGHHSSPQCHKLEFRGGHTRLAPQKRQHCWAAGVAEARPKSSATHSGSAGGANLLRLQTLLSLAYAD